MSLDFGVIDLICVCSSMSFNYRTLFYMLKTIVVHGTDDACDLSGSSSEFYGLVHFLQSTFSYSTMYIENRQTKNTNSSGGRYFKSDNN